MQRRPAKALVAFPCGAESSEQRLELIDRLEPLADLLAGVQPIALVPWDPGRRGSREARTRPPDGKSRCLKGIMNI